MKAFLAASVSIALAEANHHLVTGTIETHSRIPVDFSQTSISLNNGEL